MPKQTIVYEMIMSSSKTHILGDIKKKSKGEKKNERMIKRKEIGKRRK